MQRGPTTFYFFLLIAVCAYFRLFFGADFGDEAYYVANALLPSLGGERFVNELYMQQTSFMLFAPFVRAYAALVPENFGIMLFVRHLYYLAAMVSALHLYAFWKQRRSETEAWVAATLVLVFVPAAISSLSYNTIGYLSLFNVILLGESMKVGRLGRRPYAAGFLAAIGIIAYPTLAIPMALYFVLSARGLWQVSPKLVWRTLSTFAIFSLGFLSYLFSFGLENIRRATDFSRHFLVPSAQFASDQALTFLFTLKYAMVAGLVALVAIFLWKRRLPAPAVGLVLFANFIGYAFTFYRDLFVVAGPSNMAHLYIVNLALVFLVVTFCQPSNERDEVPWSAIVALFVTMVIFTFTSSGSVFSAAYAALPLGLLLLRNWRATKAKLIYMAATAVTLLTLGFLGLYRDWPVYRLDTWITSGPYAGIWTTYHRAQLLDDVKANLAKFPNAKTVFFYDSFPAGYLFSDKRPQGITLFPQLPPFGLSARGFHVEYYANPANLPDLVFHFRVLEFDERGFMLVNPPGANLFGDPMKEYFDHHPRYSRAGSTDYYDIYTRIP